MQRETKSCLVAQPVASAEPRKRSSAPNALGVNDWSYSVEPTLLVTLPYTLVKKPRSPTRSRHRCTGPIRPLVQMMHSTFELHRSESTERSFCTRSQPPNKASVKPPRFWHMGLASNSARRASWPRSVLACGGGTGRPWASSPRPERALKTCLALNVRSKSKTASRSGIGSHTIGHPRLHGPPRRTRP